MILFFVKYPEPGHVKTRLAACIGAEVATELYRAFIIDILSTLKIGGLPFHICFYPEEKKQLIINWLGREYHYVPQRGNNLGDRMKHGFADTFAKGYKRVIIIGSDAPDVPLSILKESLDALTRHDVVIGPSQDGGYYLIGFRDETFVSGVFDNIPWSTPSVYGTTLSLLHHQKHRKIYVLPQWNDVDTIDDIKHMIKRSPGTPFAHSHTMNFISTKIRSLV